MTNFEIEIGQTKQITFEASGNVLCTTHDENIARVLAGDNILLLGVSEGETQLIFENLEGKILKAVDVTVTRHEEETANPSDDGTDDNKSDESQHPQEEVGKNPGNEPGNNPEKNPQHPQDEDDQNGGDNNPNGGNEQPEEPDKGDSGDTEQGGHNTGNEGGGGSDDGGDPQSGDSHDGDEQGGDSQEEGGHGESGSNQPGLNPFEKYIGIDSNATFDGKVIHASVEMSIFIQFYLLVPELVQSWQIVNTRLISSGVETPVSVNYGMAMLPTLSAGIYSLYVEIRLLEKDSVEEITVCQAIEIQVQ